METNEHPPILVEDPYTNSIVNVEPLFRFNQSLFNPLRQVYPMARMVTALANVNMALSEFHLHGNTPDKWVVDTALNDLAGIIESICEMDVPQDEPEHQTA